MGAPRTARSEFAVKNGIIMRMECRVSVSRIAGAALARTFVFAWTVFAAQSAKAQTFKTLYAFKGSPDGASPYAGSLTLDAAGNLYGTTINGGGSGDGKCNAGCGTVFRLDKTGKETVLHSFGPAPDGELPISGVIRGVDGNLYGTAYWAGAYNCGAVFKITKDGQETVMYSFLGGAGNGCAPQSSLFRDAAGNLYGTTIGNTVFKVTSSGQETTIYNFTGSPDGSFPLGGLIRDALGNFYGATEIGGTTGCGGSQGCGTIFKLDSSGKETVLYRFTGGKDGAYPQFGELARDPAGNLYGMTFSGGLTEKNNCIALGCGVVFKVAPTGKETVLYRFTGGKDGAEPQASVIRDSAGNLYGMTQDGGDLNCEPPFGCGVAFKLAPSGKLTILHRFTGGNDGAGPLGGLILDKSGNIYGATLGGGVFGNGVVFKITP